MIIFSLLRTATSFLSFRSPASKREKGQGLTEYGIILVLVAVLVVAALTLLGPQISNFYSTISSNLPGN